MSDRTPDGIILYGDFSCPFSALAHRRALRRAERDSLSFEWRAVEHDPDVPVGGEVLDDASRRSLGEELDQIRSLLTDDDADDLRVPSRRLNTRELNGLYASFPTQRRCDFATAVFDAYWRKGRDPGDPAELERFDAACTSAGEVLADQWQSEWAGFERRIVPMMRLADGTLSRGLGTLARLQ